MTLRSTLVQRLYSTDSSSAVRAQVETVSRFQGTQPPLPSAVNYDFPNPRGPIFSNELRTWIGKAVPAPPSPPISNYDQPNPRGYVYSTELRTFLQNIAPTNPLPSNITNWPNPIGYQHPQDLRSWINKGFNELEAGIILIPAEANYDWPNPKGYIYPSDLRTFTQNTSQSLKSLAPVPLIPFDWPNPIVKTWTPAPVVFTNSLQGLGLQPPVKQLDWPNPVRQTNPVDYLSYTNRSDLLYGFLAPPINQTEWPNPRGYVYPSDLRFWSQGIIAAEDTPPGNQYAWPNPILGKWSPGNLTFISGISRELASVVNTPPATTYDRPNPTGPILAIGLKTGQSYSIPLPLLSFVPPVTTGQHNRYFFADMGSMWSNM